MVLLLYEFVLFTLLNLTNLIYFLLLFYFAFTLPTNTGFVANL